jgi:hypothetical protein
MQILKKLAYLIMFSQLLTACKNLKRMLPEGPAFSNNERTEWQKKAAHKVHYTDVALTDFPVPAVQAWAATYDLDIILVSKHPEWNMHEFARLTTPQGDLWIMKDAQEGSLDQFVVADLDDIQAWLPELPVQRKSYPVKVVDRSTNKKLQLSFEYENYLGVLVKASYEGKRPVTPLQKKNGSTMGHSKNQLLVGLDLPFRDFGQKADISYDGVAYKMDKILGLVPFQMALKQTQGGLSSGQYTLEATSHQLVSSHFAAQESIEQTWQTFERQGMRYLQQRNDFRTTTYAFEQEGCLKSASIQQWNKEDKGMQIQFYPALPDIRRPFRGSYSSKFVLDIGGKNNNAYGWATVFWENGKAVVQIIPEKPWWVVDRPMQTTISYKGNQAVIEIKMMK